MTKQKEIEITLLALTSYEASLVAIEKAFKTISKLFNELMSQLTLLYNLCIENGNLAKRFRDWFLYVLDS